MKAYLIVTPITTLISAVSTYSLPTPYKDVDPAQETERNQSWDLISSQASPCQTSHAATRPQIPLLVTINSGSISPSSSSLFSDWYSIHLPSESPQPHTLPPLCEKRPGKPTIMSETPMKACLCTPLYRKITLKPTSTITAQPSVTLLISLKVPPSNSQTSSTISITAPTSETLPHSAPDQNDASNLQKAKQSGRFPTEMNPSLNLRIAHLSCENELITEQQAMTQEIKDEAMLEYNNAQPMHLLD